METAVSNARKAGTKIVTIQFATIHKHAMHPQEGIPLIYHDQLNIIATHLADIKQNIEEQGLKHQN